MEADLVRLGRAVAVALLRPDVDDDRAALVERPAERVLERAQVVAGHDADVADAQVLEQAARLLRELDHRVAEPLRQLEHALPEERHPLDGPVVGGPADLPGHGELDRREVLREGADRGADRHLVVVEDDEHPRLALADVVEGLEREAAHEGGVADDDGDPLEAVAQVTGRGEALGDRESRAGVAAVEDIVRRLRAPREAADAVDLAERAESLEPAGEELVRVCLVAGVPDDPVARRLHEPVEDDRELDDAERAAEVAARPGDGLDDRRADLAGQRLELGVGQAAQVGRAGQVGQDRHGMRALLVRRFSRARSTGESGCL